MALTLRLVCGVTTAHIARAFLVSEPTVAARITRAKRKISSARIPYRIPRPAELPARLRAVLAVIHLLFTAGHTAPSGQALVQAGLVDQALHLARMLRELLPDDAEVRGLLALLLVTDARRATRADDSGRLLRLPDQDRSRWDQAALAEAQPLIVASLTAGPPGRYVLQAAIASLYAEAPSYDQTDFPQIVVLYDRLLEVWPSPWWRSTGPCPGHGPRAAGRAGRGGAARAGRPPGRVPVPARGQGRPAAPGRPRPRSGRRLPPGPRGHGQRGRTRLPRPSGLRIIATSALLIGWFVSWRRREVRLPPTQKASLVPS